MQYNQYRQLKPLSSIQTIIQAILVVLLLAGTKAWCQSDRLYRLYEAHDYSQLQKELNKMPARRSGELELKFFRALFYEDGELAHQAYEEVFAKSQGRLKNLAAKKLNDYYYAKGYYITAAKYQKYLVEQADDEVNMIAENPEQNTRNKPVRQQKEDPEGTYYIQVGAFSIEDNARQQVDMFQTQNIGAQLVKRRINDETLYCVWIRGGGDFQATLNLANRIKSKYEIDYRIIKK